MPSAVTSEMVRYLLIDETQRGAYIDPRRSAETFGAVATQWFATKGHRKPKTVVGYRSILDTLVLPKWGEVPLKQIDYQADSTWLGGLAVDGSQRRTALSASRITQAHQLVGAVLKSAQRTPRLPETWRRRSSGPKICQCRRNGGGGT
jgi:hypothetical protein